MAKNRVRRASDPGVDQQTGEIKVMVWNSLNARYRPKKYAVNKQPSKTIPDQSMSIKELIKRYASGQSLGGNLDPIYEDEETPNMGINPKTLDLVDLQRMKMENEAKLERLKQQRRKEVADHEVGRKKAAEKLKEAENDEKLLKEVKEKAKAKKENPEGH